LRKKYKEYKKQNRISSDHSTLFLKGMYILWGNKEIILIRMQA